MSLASGEEGATCREGAGVRSSPVTVSSASHGRHPPGRELALLCGPRHPTPEPGPTATACAAHTRGWVVPVWSSWLQPARHPQLRGQRQRSSQPGLGGEV